MPVLKKSRYFNKLLFYQDLKKRYKLLKYALVNRKPYLYTIEVL